jgi:hypothetical protein
MRDGWRRPIAADEAGRIVADMNRRGYGMLRDYLSNEELEGIRGVAREAVRAKGGDFALLEGPAAVAGTVLAELPRAPAFEQLCRTLYEKGAPGAPLPDSGVYQYVRCVQGPTGQSRRQADNFHYDDYVLTTLLPVEIPERGGHFLIIPNVRPVRRSYLLSLVEHHLVSARLVGCLLKQIVHRGMLNSTAIKLQPGTLYCFWGYRSIHASEPCDPDRLRTTALFFYGAPPNANSRWRAVLRALRAPSAPT